MNHNRFTLPAIIAAAGHAALLLAGRQVNLPPGAAPEETAPAYVCALPLEPVALPPEDPGESPAETPAGGEPCESLPEPPERPVRDGFEIPQPSIRPMPDAVTTERIPLTPHGGGPGEGPGWGPPTGPIAAAGLDREPRATVQVAPDYPFEMRRQGVGGTVWVELVVGPDGGVRTARATSSTHRDFEAPTVRAVQKWRFEPGKRRGRPTSFVMTVPVHFSLENR